MSRYIHACTCACMYACMRGMQAGKQAFNAHVCIIRIYGIMCILCK